MKKNIVILFAVLAAFLAGCSQIDSVMENQEEDCVIALAFEGDITTSEEPLTKASSNDLYLVQVYRGTNSFALGIYDNKDNIRINLKKNTTDPNANKYRIIVSLIRNGKTLLGSTIYKSGNNSINSYNSNHKSDSYYISGYNSTNYYYPINTTYYNSVKTFYYYNGNTSTLSSSTSASLKLANIGSACINGSYPACDDWFYGEITDYVATGQYQTLTMNMKRVIFKLKCEVSGATDKTGAVDGQVTVQVYKEYSSSSRTTLFNVTTTTATYTSDTKTFAIPDIQGAWKTANFVEELTLSVSWKHSIGVTENFGTKKIYVKRNCVNNLKINMTGNDQETGLGINVESETTIGSAKVTIPVE